MKHQIQNTRSRGVRTSAAILTATALAACGGGSSGTAVESFSYAEDGFTYEREAIAEWVARTRTSPTTGSSMGATLVPNHVLRKLMS